MPLLFFSLTAHAYDCTVVNRKIPLGKVGPYSIAALDAVYFDGDEESDCGKEPDPDTAGSNEILLEARQGKEVLSESLSTIPLGYNRASASLVAAKRKGNAFVVSIHADGVEEDENTVTTDIYSFNLKTKKFLHQGSSAISPAMEERAKILATIRAGNPKDAKALLKKFDTSTLGSDTTINDIVREIALAAWKPTMKAYQSKNSAKLKEWLDFFGHEFTEKGRCPFGSEDACDASEVLEHWWPYAFRPAAAFNDFAFFLAAAGDKKSAEFILRQVLLADPARTPAYLNLADLLWDKGEKEESAFLYRIYLARLGALGLAKGAPAAAQSRSGEAAKQSQFSPEAQRKAVGAERTKLGGKEMASFDSLLTVPGEFLKGAKTTTDAREATLAKPFALRGIPLAVNTRIAERMYLPASFEGTLGAALEKNGIALRVGAPVSLRNNLLERGTADKEVDIQGYKLKAGAPFAFNGDKLEDFTSREEFRFGKFRVAKDTHLRIGYSVVLTLAEASRFYGQELPLGSQIRMQDTKAESDEEIKFMEVHAPAALQFPQFSAAWFELDSAGFPTRAQLAAPMGSCAAGNTAVWDAKAKTYNCIAAINSTYAPWAPML